MYWFICLRLGMLRTACTWHGEALAFVCGAARQDFEARTLQGRHAHKNGPMSGLAFPFCLVLDFVLEYWVGQCRLSVGSMLVQAPLQYVQCCLLTCLKRPLPFSWVSVGFISCFFVGFASFCDVWWKASGRLLLTFAHHLPLLIEFNGPVFHCRH